MTNCTCHIDEDACIEDHGPAEPCGRRHDHDDIDACADEAKCYTITERENAR